MDYQIEKNVNPGGRCSFQCFSYSEFGKFEYKSEGGSD